jgi:hypothetical protein
MGSGRHHPPSLVLSLSFSLTWGQFGVCEFFCHRENGGSEEFRNGERPPLTTHQTQRTCTAGSVGDASPTAMTPNAAVLPVPDRARTRRSAPARPRGMAAAWSGVWGGWRGGEVRGGCWLARAANEKKKKKAIETLNPLTCTGDGSRNPASARPSVNQAGSSRSAKEGAAAAASAVRGRRRRGCGGGALPPPQSSSSPRPLVLAAPPGFASILLVQEMGQAPRSGGREGRARALAGVREGARPLAARCAFLFFGGLLTSSNKKNTHSQPSRFLSINFTTCPARPPLPPAAPPACPPAHPAHTSTAHAGPATPCQTSPAPRAGGAGTRPGPTRPGGRR